MNCDYAGCARDAAITLADGTELCRGHVAEVRELHAAETQSITAGEPVDVDVELDAFYADLPVDRPAPSIDVNETLDEDGGGPGYRTHHPDSAGAPHPANEDA